jgi:hypothetical protein
MNSLALGETDEAKCQAKEDIEDGPHIRRLLLSEVTRVLLE